MMRPLLLLGGLVCVPMYGYNWVMTLAQLELIGNDRPLSLLKKREGKGGKMRAPSAEKILKALEIHSGKAGGRPEFLPGEYVNIE